MAAAPAVQPHRRYHSSRRRYGSMSKCAGLLCSCAAPFLASAAPYGLPDDAPQAPVLSPNTWEYSMTWVYGRQGVTKMSDFEVSADSTCASLSQKHVKWEVLREKVAAALTSLQDEAISVVGDQAPARQYACMGSVQEARDAVGDFLDEDTRFSSWRNDCVLGALALLLLDLVCSMRAFVAAAVVAAMSGNQIGLPDWMFVWPEKWHKAQLELEGLFFYVELPWSTLITAQWSLASLFSRLARGLHVIGAGHANSCDERETDEDKRLLSHADARGLLPLHIAEDFVTAQWGRMQREDIINQNGQTGCPFSLSAALLSMALWALRAGGHLTGGPAAGQSPAELINRHAQMVARSWEEHTTQFFYDILTSHWRLWDLLETIAEAWTEFPVNPHIAAKKLELTLGNTPSLIVADARAALEVPKRVLFLGGGESTFQWGSFTVRGRQVARGLRNIGIDARSWNGPCSAYCEFGTTPGAWTPTSFIHIKYVCECALKEWRSAVHVYDPVDVFENLLDLKVDALLMQTSMAKSDLESHPPLRASGGVNIFWLPMHHSNQHNVRWAGCFNSSLPVKSVGIHTVHKDYELHDLIKRLLKEEHGDSNAEFVHHDPAALFAYSLGKVSTPQQTDSVYEQIATLDVGLIKQSGCISEWWFCSRWKTGQRLVNLLSVGVPAIVYGNAQGHLDVTQGLWPPDVEEIAMPESYPSQLVVQDDRGVATALAALFSNATLRREASEKGRRLAARFSLPAICTRLAQILWMLEQSKLVVQDA